MRSWIVCLLMVLLPWRLWAADAMALQTLHGNPVPAQHMPCHGAGPGVWHDALAVDGAVHSQPFAYTDAHHETHSFSATADHSHHGMCLLCDVCHNAMGMTPQGQVPHTQTPAHPQTSLKERVVSALGQPGFKPPIG